MSMLKKDKKLQVFVSQSWLDEVDKTVKNGKRGQIVRACLLLYVRRHDFRQIVDSFIEKFSVGTI